MIRKKKEQSGLKRRNTERPKPHSGLGRFEPSASIGSVAVVDDTWLDQRALLRWADDGGRWVKGAEVEVASHSMH